MIFGHVWENENPYLASVEFNPVIRKVRFFINDRWLLVGEFKTIVYHKGQKDAALQIQLPDVGAFMMVEAQKDNGAEDWYKWGPRVN